jgi:hypothetical protein
MGGNRQALIQRLSNFCDEHALVMELIGEPKEVNDSE